ncbi:MAG: alpha-L-fucosidase [Phycisphaerae bacterium]|nr:alpha-L-fucosidase [Phycisphaerae bacterium]
MKNKTRQRVIGVVMIVTCWAVSVPAVHAAQREEDRLAWWRDARFGMFIHWGPVSLTGKEIGWARGSDVPIEEYDQLYKRFNPQHFDADAWAATAKDAGMKYIVLTTKHHDGFCLWDTKQTDFNIMHSPFGRDVVKELSDACRRAGLRFSTYYSTCDWHHPDFPLTSPGGRVQRKTSNLDRYEQYLRAQVKELITQYGPLGVLWFDVPQRFDAKRGQGVIDFVRSLQPDIIVNNRSGAPGDYDTPEQRVGKYQDDRPWETCMTICRQWAWKPNDTMKSLQECLQNLILCAGGDGNLLFNVGPTADGVIEARQVTRLQEMGQWMAAHGHTIYGTRGGPWKPTKAVASTRKGNVIYLHILRWNQDVLELPDIDRRILSATLPSGKSVQVEKRDGRLFVQVDPSDRDAMDTIVTLTLNRSAMDLTAISLGKPVKAAASNVFQKMDSEYGPAYAFDNDPETRWATDSGTHEAWVSRDFEKPVTLVKVRIDEAYAPRVQKFELQYRVGTAWKTILTGTTLGRWFQQEFTPVTAQEFRLNILEATDGPTIHDIEFFEK